MEIFIYIDDSDLSEIANDVSSSLETWINESETKATLVNQKHAENEADSDDGVSDWKLGVNIEVSKGRQLKTLLNFLYKIAKEYKCDFVLGIFDSKTKTAENICYFGNEEGKPDVYEISSYLGIRI